MGLIALKVTCIFIAKLVLMFPIVEFITGLVPYFFSKRLKVGGKRKELLLKFISDLLSFGEGVLLAVEFIGLLQVIQDSLNSAREHPKEVIRYVFPWH